MANQHGLDVHYFKKNLEKILLEIDCYTPEEMQTALHRLSRVTSDAKAEILQKCANCGKEKSAKELSVCMDYRQMHGSVLQIRRFYVGKGKVEWEIMTRGWTS